LVNSNDHHQHKHRSQGEAGAEHGAGYSFGVRRCFERSRTNTITTTKFKNQKAGPMTKFYPTGGPFSRRDFRRRMAQRMASVAARASGLPIAIVEQLRWDLVNDLFDRREANSHSN
jgi:hypothetical protein